MGWDQSTGTTDHAALMAYVAGLDDAALAHVKQDSVAAAAAMPDGIKAGYYIDTAHYCGMQQVKRGLV